MNGSRQERGGEGEGRGGAGGGTRTPDLDFTKVLLYQLSYAGTALARRLTRAGGARKIRAPAALGKPQSPANLPAGVTASQSSDQAGGTTKQDQAGGSCRMAAAYTLYGSFLSAPTYKVALMLTLCGQAYDYRHVDLAKGEHKTPDFLQLNRYGQVPVLRHGALTLCQSNTILEYLAEGPGSKFAGSGPTERQRIREWMMWETDRLYPGINRTRFFERFAKPDPAVTDFMRKVGEQALGVLDGLLDGKRFLVGERPTIADLCVFGCLAHMAEARFDIGHWPAVKAWWERVTALPGFLLPYDLLPKADRDAA